MLSLVVRCPSTKFPQKMPFTIDFLMDPHIITTVLSHRGFAASFFLLTITFSRFFSNKKLIKLSIESQTYEVTEKLLNGNCEVTA